MIYKSPATDHKTDKKTLNWRKKTLNWQENIKLTKKALNWQKPFNWQKTLKWQKTFNWQKTLNLQQTLKWQKNIKEASITIYQEEGTDWMIRIICLKCCTFMFYLKVFRKKRITFRCSRYQECRVNPITLKSCEILFNKQWILKNKNFIGLTVPAFVFVFAFIFVFV